MNIWWRQIIGTLFLFLLLSGFWTLSYWLTSKLLQYMQWEPSFLVIQLVNSLLGILLFIATVLLISQLTHKKRDSRQLFWGSIVDAMEQISQGNYNVHVPKLSKHDHHAHPFDEMIDQLNKMAKNLGEMEDMRQQFVSNVSHEIQSPLTSIKGFAVALQNESISQEQRTHYLKIIEEESERLSHLSDNLLKLTTLEAKEPSLSRGRYRLDEQLRHIVLATEPQWSNKQLDIQLKLSPVYIVAEKELLNQVWTNLLNNAIKFTPSAGVINILLEEKEDEIIVVVADDGVGMSAETKVHVFERFYKEDQARSRKLGGNGLGMSIVKKVIDLHRGKITVESKPQQGTAIHIQLPKCQSLRS